jgi:aspartyl-tRNA(Asn)/glutamyl-tRNA(Gln) amidotransferase subunit C
VEGRQAFQQDLKVNTKKDWAAMSVDRETVRKIAKLARIRVPEEGLEPLAGELNNILGWIEQLSELNTDGVEPMTSVVEIEAPQRPDVVNDGGIADEAVANAPDSVGAFFSVPKVLE